MKVNLKSYFSLFIAIGLAFVIAAILVKTKPDMQHVATEMPSKAVEVITASNIPFSTRITAYGNVEPAITLNSTAEVSGKISYVHPNLKAGETIPAGTVVVRIDAKDYDVSLKQTQADLAASRASLKELGEAEKSTQRAMKLAQKNLKVGEAEYARIKEVYEQKVVTKSSLDAEEQKVIRLRQSLEDLQGKINSYESRRQSVKSQIARAEQAVQNSETILGRTKIILPFDARIGAVDIDKNEFVAVGSALFEAVDLKGVEITARLPIDSMRKLVSHLEGTTAGNEQIIRAGGRINDSLNLTTKVRLVIDMPMAVWDARFLRISDSIDATRQTLGLVVGVDNPYQKIIPGKRPPLIKGMFTAVDIFAPAHDAMVVPRKAVHQGRVYIANSDNQLEIRPVDVLLIQGDLVVVRSGIEQGERVIITDLIPVIEGMPLQITTATDFETEMKKRALGADAVASRENNK
jgi:multidrug efflux pump subunit AcrA (membrane-fusion protein)